MILSSCSCRSWGIRGHVVLMATSKYHVIGIQVVISGKSETTKERSRNIDRGQCFKERTALEIIYLRLMALIKYFYRRRPNRGCANFQRNLRHLSIALKPVAS